MDVKNYFSTQKIKLTPFLHLKYVFKTFKTSFLKNSNSKKHLTTEKTQK